MRIRRHADYIFFADTAHGVVSLKRYKVKYCEEGNEDEQEEC